MAYASERLSPAKLIRFVASASVATLVHLGVMYVVNGAAQNIHLAFAIGFICGVVARYFVDRYFVFQLGGGGHARYLVRYGLACLLSYAISSSLFRLFLDVFGMPSVVAFIGSILLSTLIGFFLLGFALTPKKTAS